MENENAYQAPQADVVVEPQVSNNFVYTGPTSRGIGSGFSWVAQGFALFKEYPGQWVLTMIVGFLIALILSIIPVVGSIASGFMTYVWVGGLMIGCQAIVDGKPFKLEYLFAGFKHRVGALIGLSCLLLFVSLGLMMVVVGSVYFDIMMQTEGAMEQMDPMTLALKVLLAMALLLPVFMAAWFAPALITLQNMSVFDAMKASFKACLINFFPFLIYGIVLLVIYILGAIPLLLGLLIVIPTIFGSMHASYQDIFLSEQQEHTTQV